MCRRISIEGWRRTEQTHDLQAKAQIQGSSAKKLPVHAKARFIAAWAEKACLSKVEGNSGRPISKAKLNYSATPQ
jgi:hypothetical protein